ncbi:hypothetical protein Droror1_Dr00022331 [Drosera rotundifolia]
MKEEIFRHETDLVSCLRICWTLSWYLCLWRKSLGRVFCQKAGGTNGFRFLISCFLIRAYHVLLRLRGKITKFYLDIPLLDTDHWAISDWIEIVSGNSLQDFKLCIPKSAPYLKLPRCFFSCQNLRHLELHCCEFNPPVGFNGFTHLVSLVIQGFEMESELLSSLLRRCPLLESLTLEAFRDTNLEFQALNLKFLLITGTISYISITSPILATLSLKVDVTSIGEDNMSRGLQICGRATVLEKFISKHEINVVRSMLKASPSCMSQVKYIELHNFLFVDDLKDALLLLRGSPNLQKLIVKEFMYEEEDDINYDVLHKQVRECYDAEISKEILLSHLEGVDITTGFGYGTQEFIKFLLEKSPALLDVHIQISSEVPIGTGLVNFFSG